MHPPEARSRGGACVSSWKLRMSRRDIRVSHDNFRAAPPRRASIYANDLKCPQCGRLEHSTKKLRSTFHFIRLNIVFLVLLIILSSIKWSEYISDSSRTIYRKCISDVSFFNFANSQPFSWDIRISRSSNDLKCSTMRAAPIALVRRRGGGMHGIPMMNYSISNLNWEVQYSK